MAKSSSHKIHVYGSATDTAVKCPFGQPFPDLRSSWILSGPTCSGKSQILMNLILRYYKGLFARVFVFSPSIKIDPTYGPLRKFLDQMSSDPQREPFYFDDLDQTQLGKIIDEQQAICESCKKRGIKEPEILIVVDDMADRPDVLNRRQSGRNQGGSWMTSLAVRGRHLHISCLVSTQCLNMVALCIRKNVRNILV